VIAARVVLVALLLSCVPALAGEPSMLVPPGESVAGRSQADWSRAWWQWAGSFESADSPVADRSGEKCHLKQNGPVWFLAGTYGTRRTTRTCTIPAGRYIFFPLINFAVFPRHPVDLPTCESVTRAAKRTTEDATALVLSLDGRQPSHLERHRQATAACFDLGALADPPQVVFPTAANGYYAMLRPLAPGRYELEFGGALPSMLQAVTYHLTVE
jgi:hypothetical protein